MNFTPESPCKVLVLYSDMLIRAGIVASLRQHAIFDVLEDASRAEAPAYDAVDVVIADYQQAMRSVDPASLATRAESAQGKVLIVTDNERAVDIERALRAGVPGYVLLGGALSELVEGAATVARGSRYLSTKAIQRMADFLVQESLTARESDVLELVAAGESNKAIARRLNIETATVKSHLRAIFSKLNATSRTQAAQIAFTRGLVAESASAPPAPRYQASSRQEFMTAAGA